MADGGCDDNRRKRWLRSPGRALTERYPSGHKRENYRYGHLKAYQIDGRLLRTGAANFSASGLKQQDNDLIIIADAAAAAEFRRHFEAIFAASEPLPAGAFSRGGVSRETWLGVSRETPF
ncbi:phospholipase D-like domain-containing protein [Methylocella sp.]|uniref:phospholipase D-like domain-containing protein n=1 Tax=Methylocella sp. TaxID=1978226 RepID=UPI003C1C4617